MNKKQRIIISIVGAIIVLLALLGLTFGYYLTRIQGNTNNKSLSVTTANLELTYGDDNAEIIGENMILTPSDDVIGTKTFTVTNNGNDTSYVVIIENTSVTNAIDGTTTTFESNDFRYTLTCTKSDGSSCNEVLTQSVFPINGGILVGNNITEGDVHTYTFKMWYIDTGVDQSNDMGKTLRAKLNIANLEGMENPYSSNKSSLAYSIINNAKLKTNGTELLSTPKSKVAEEISKKEESDEYTTEAVTTGSLCSEYRPWLVGDSASAAQSGSTVSSFDAAVGKYVYDQCSNWTKYLESYDSSTSTLYFRVNAYNYEKVLSATSDDYGISYYYRGNVTDNYVDFANMCWRIVRISGDGSIKLILEDQDSTCATSDGSWNIPTTTGGTVKTGNFGETDYAKNTLTASDGTQNSNTVTIYDYLNGKKNNDKSIAYAFENFQTGPLANYLSYLKVGNWCLNDKTYSSLDDNSKPLTSTELLDKQIKEQTYYYDSRVRLYGKTTKEPTLVCNGTILTKFADNTDMYVGTITADEVVFAGGKTETMNPNYYLINDYQTSNKIDFWTMSPLYYVSFYDFNAGAENTGSLSYVVLPDARSFRPAINLKSNISISSGDGTKDNAYKVS